MSALAATSGSKDRRLGYRPALDGIRALAIVGVVLLHALEWPSGGALGVDLFFVLSGFLITTLLLEEHAEHGTVSLRAFYRRRAYRLLPALFLMLGVYLAVAAGAALARGESLSQPLFGVLAGLGYFTNLAQMTDPSSMPRSLTHLWSLAEEEQFYLVWPVVLFAALRARIRLAIAFTLVGIALSTLRAIQLNLDGASDYRMGIGLDTAVVPILAGCLLALLLTTRVRAPLERAGRVLGPVALLGVLFFFFGTGGEVYGGFRWLFSLYAALLILVALDARSLVARPLSIRPVVYLGKISYSLYIWHAPLLILFAIRETALEWQAIPVLALSLAAAIASYHLVELPFLRRKNRPARQRIEEPQPVPVPA
jgi:peptidoglycan/LPS O-acetylase OafA/YrhL